MTTYKVTLERLNGPRSSEITWDKVRESTLASMKNTFLDKAFFLHPLDNCIVNTSNFDILKWEEEK